MLTHVIIYTITDEYVGRWLENETLPGFRKEALSFMKQAQSVSEKLMTCFARGLGFDDDYFVKAHDVSRPESQTVCRLLHYFETPEVPSSNGEVYHRAGAHADWDLLTLLFLVSLSSSVASFRLSTVKLTNEDLVLPNSFSALRL